MAFRLDKGAPTTDGLRRVVRKEFRKSLKALSAQPDREAIHQARKSVKKIRSVLRLVREDLGRAYAKENRRLRTAAHCLSA